MPPLPLGTVRLESFTSAAFSAENRAQQALFRRQFGLALRRDLADQNIARLHLGALKHHAAAVEVAQRILADVRNITGDLLRPELGFTAGDLELIHMDAGVDVLLDQTLGNDDRVLEVVPAPRHVGHQHVAAERELAVLGRGAVRQDVALLHGLAVLDDRALVHAGSGIAAQILVETVILIGLLVRIGSRQIAVRRHDDMLGTDLRDDAVRLRGDHGAGVAGDPRFQAGADIRRLRHQQRHRLALHVRPHQGAVRVVMLQERNDAGGGADQLLRRHVHILNRLARMLFGIRPCNGS